MPFCGHCKNLGKTEREYTSHFPRKTPSQNSQITCPELLKNVCTNCSSRNHTYDKCNKKIYNKPVVQPPAKKLNTNKYDILDTDEEIDYGEELYAIVAKDYPMCAGKITGMFLELDQAEIIEMLENSALLKERTKEAIDILDANYPCGYHDAMFIPPSVYSHSLACVSEDKEINMSEYLAYEEIVSRNPILNDPNASAQTKIQAIVDDLYEEFSFSDRFQSDDDDW